MKKAERIIVYGIALLAIFYGFFKRGELQMESSHHRSRMAYYYPYSMKGAETDVLFFTPGDYDKITIELVSNSLSKSTCKRLGDLLYFWVGYRDRWRLYEDILLSETKLEKVEAELAESTAILKWCEGS